MSKILQYKDYVGSVEISTEDNIFYGKVQGIRDLISYEGETVSELMEDFRDAIDDYLLSCEERGKIPEKAYKGSFNVRISPQLHKYLAIQAIEHDTTLNHYIEEKLTVLMR